MLPLTEEEFNKAFKLYYRPLYWFCSKTYNDKEQIKDLIQDSFVSLWLNRDKVPFEKVQAYLYVSISNKLKNVIRHESVVIINKDGAAEFMGLNEEIHNIAIVNEQKAIMYKVISLLYEAIEKLPPKRKELILAHLQLSEKKNGRDIADILNSNYNTFKETKSKAYRFLKKELKDKINNIYDH